MIQYEQLAKKFEFVDVMDPTEDEKKALQRKYGLLDETFTYAYDIDERARTEYEEESGMTMVIYDTVLDQGDTASDPTAPVTFMFNQYQLILFTRTNTHFVADLVRKSNHELSVPLDLILYTIYDLTPREFDAIRSIDRERKQLQKSLQNKITRSSVTKLMSLQTQLVYYTASIKSNREVVVSIQQSKNFVKLQDQFDQIEDDLIELDQGIEVAGTAANVIEHIADAYASVMDIELNATMKTLTIFSIFMAIPAMIFGFYGMNVSLPFRQFGWLGTVIISLIFVVIGSLLYRFSQRFYK